MIDSMIPYFVVDAFTHRPFAGNPAAVALLEEWKDDKWLQNVAMELNLSETAFLVANSNGFDLRWFTPAAEVDLCGHATLASAVVLAELQKFVDRSRVTFSTRSGDLTVERYGSLFQMDFPGLNVVPCQPPPDLLESLSGKALYVGQSKFDYVIEFESEEAIRSIKPNFNALANVKCRGVVVTARSVDRQFDFVSRFFAPALGINEDPVTGSAHCILAPFWGSRLGKSKMVGYQASSRGGVVQVELRGDRVILGGQGVIFGRGQIAGA
ncbi:MAG TPA: PhzF family phenazine biosynthesis protein [Verrucomicrobiae bacterium]